jgi:hypothetical protein
VETLFGRRLYLPEINARNKMRQQAAERTAINAPMQGTAADIIKRAMLDVDDWLQRRRQVDARMIMQVHDELVLEVAEDQLDSVWARPCASAWARPRNWPCRCWSKRAAAPTGTRRTDFFSAVGNLPDGRRSKQS